MDDSPVHPTRCFPSLRVILASLGVLSASIWSSMLRMCWIFDSNFPRGSIFYFDVNFLELSGPSLLAPIAGYLSDTISVPFPRRWLSVLSLCFFFIGFGCQLAYRSPVDDNSKWHRELMAPAYLFVQLAATFLDISSRCLLTDFGFTEGQTLAHAAGGAMWCVGNLVVYAAVRLFVPAPTGDLWDHGWDPYALRWTQIGLAVASSLSVVVSTLSGEDFRPGPRVAIWHALFNVDRCANFWRVALPFALAACAHHQVLLVAPAIFHQFLGYAIEGYFGGFWLGFGALAAGSGLGVVAAAFAPALERAGWLRASFASAQIVGALGLAAFSYACWGKASLTAVYVIIGVGLGMLRVVPFALLGENVAKGEVGRCVSLMVVLAIVGEQVIQADYWENSMDLYYPWPHVWVFMIVAGFVASGLPAGQRREQGQGQGGGQAALL